MYLKKCPINIVFRGIATSCGPAADIGFQVLKEGGNAIDAMVAVQ